MFRVEQEEAIRFYCGVSEQVWNHHPVAPGAYACISPVSGRHEDTPESRRVNYVRIPPGTAVIQDSGAFSDGPRQRLSVEEALERQIAHAERFGYASQLTHRASYDLLIDEKWEGGLRYKARWSEEDAARACQLTVKAASYLSRHRYGLGAILSAQGVSAKQYLLCAEHIVPSLQEGDIFGLGGWCITGKFPRHCLPVFRETMQQVIPFLSREGVKRVHVWGVCYAQALGELLWLCDQYGLVLSTDSAGPALRPALGRWGYASWSDPSYRKPPNETLGRHRKLHVYLTRRWLRDFRSREAGSYRFVPIKPKPIQLKLDMVS